MSSHEYKQTPCREYSQGICHDGAAILKDGEPMTIEEILEDLRSGQSASNQASCEGLIHLTRDHWQALSQLEYAVRQGRGHASITEALERLSEIHDRPVNGDGTDICDGTNAVPETDIDPLFEGPDVPIEDALGSMEEERRLNEEHLGGDRNSQKTEPQCEIPSLTSSIINECAWAFIEAMPHNIPGPIWNDLKPAIYEVIKRYEAAREQEGAEAVAWTDHGNLDLLSNGCATSVFPVCDKEKLLRAVPLYIRPPQSQGVPEGWKTAAKGAVDFVKADGMVLHYPQVAVETITGLANLILSAPSTPAAPRADEWTPHYEYPETGKPVLGYHPDWVDEDFCPDGIRECFTFGDGTEWQSARWDGYSDLWVAEDGAPTLWIKHPQPPEQEGQ